MTSSEMIMSSGGGLTFMYRVGGIAVYDGHLLVEHNTRHGFSFVPGGRVEYGENAVEALARELREELGEEVKVGRLLLVADNLFEIDGDRFQEITLYFLIEFAPGSAVLDRASAFEGGESGSVFQWISLAEVEQANLLPPFLRQLARDLPASPEYIAHAEPGFLDSPGHDRHPGDEVKSQTNIAQGRIGFEAIETFEWDTAITRRSDRHGEPRWAALGFIDNWLYHVVFTERGDEIRIISLRKASRSERSRYDRERA